MYIGNIEKDKTILLKGISILLISLHNYFHLIFKKTKENEIDFEFSRFFYFLSDFLVTPTEWLQSLFTYFGHFGVQVFIFLSAYSLTISYRNIDSIFWFLSGRIRKLYPVFIAAILVWMILMGYKDGGIYGLINIFNDNVQELVFILIGIYPFIPGAIYPVVGPWWFIPFILQFYILWAVMSKFNLLNSLMRNHLIIIIGLGVIFNYTVTPFAKEQFDINLLFTPFGHLPEIFAGVYVAKYSINMSKIFLITSTAMLLLSGYYSWLWPFHHISALIVFLYFMLVTLQYTKGWINKIIYWLGTISLPLFLVNGFLRGPFVSAAREYQIWYADILLGFLFFCVACLASFLMVKGMLITRKQYIFGFVKK